jgi:hypothetical protein
MTKFKFSMQIIPVWNNFYWDVKQIVNKINKNCTFPIFRFCSMASLEVGPEFAANF